VRTWQVLSLNLLFIAKKAPDRFLKEQPSDRPEDDSTSVSTLGMDAWDSEGADGADEAT
jgi:hypothetical protein